MPQQLEAWQEPEASRFGAEPNLGVLLPANPAAQKLSRPPADRSFWLDTIFGSDTVFGPDTVLGRETVFGTNANPNSKPNSKPDSTARERRDASRDASPDASFDASFDAPFDMSLAGRPPAPLSVADASILDRPVAASTARASAARASLTLDTLAPETLAPDTVAPDSLSPNSLAPLIHDARNMVSAMDLYCDLLEAPGVLAEPFRHYAGELRLVGKASRKLLEKLALEQQEHSLGSFQFGSARTRGAEPGHAWLRSSSSASQPSRSRSQIGTGSGNPAGATLPSGSGLAAAQPVLNLAEELRSNLNLIVSLLGPAVTVSLAIHGGNHPIAMTGDDLTRVLLNLARNASEAMPQGGYLQIGLEERPGRLILSFTDNGPGIPESVLETIFTPGYSTRGLQESSVGPAAWPVQHRGLGLSIVRSLMAAARGSVWAANRKELDPDAQAPAEGAVFTLEFPIDDPPCVT